MTTPNELRVYAAAIEFPLWYDDFRDPEPRIDAHRQVTIGKDHAPR